MKIRDEVKVLELIGDALEWEKEDLPGKEGKIIDINFNYDNPYVVRLNNGNIVNLKAEEMNKI